METHGQARLAAMRQSKETADVENKMRRSQNIVDKDWAR